MSYRYHVTLLSTDIQSQTPETHDRLVPEDLTPLLSIVSLPSSNQENRGPMSLPGLLSGSAYFHELNRTSSDGFFTEAITEKLSLISDLETVKTFTSRAANLARQSLPGNQHISTRSSIRLHLLFLLKVLGITTFFFLVDLPIEGLLLTQNGTYQIVNLAIVIILYSNIMSITVLRHYRLTFDPLKTTIRLKAVKKKDEAVPVIQSHRSEQLRNIHDTTAYLQALKKVFSNPGGQP